MSNDKADATWHPRHDLGVGDSRALDRILDILNNRVGDPDIANAVAITCISNVLATTGRVAS